MAHIVDADTHIVEHPGIWECMDKDMYARRPILLKTPRDALYGDLNAFWLIDGKIIPKRAGKGSVQIHVPGGVLEDARKDIHADAKLFTNVSARLAEMDQRGVDVEIVYPTLFIVYLTDDVELEISLCEAFGRYMGQAYEEGQGRLRWIAPLPLRSVEASIKQMQVAKNTGAAGVLFRGVEGNRSLAEPYFYPIYEEASRLDLPICIHTGAGSPLITEAFDIRVSSAFPHGRMLPLIAFRDLVNNKVPERFPDLRVGFIEASASWVPYVFHNLRSSARAPFVVGPEGLEWDEWWGPKLFRDYRFYVACEASEDIPYLLRYIGEDNMIVGSDYGHTDPSRDDSAFTTIERRPDVPDGAKHKLFSTNPRRFYGLPGGLY